jgi:hypothetical protein
VLENDKRKMIASLDRNPEMKGNKRRTRDRLTLLSGLIQLDVSEIRGLAPSTFACATNE